MNTSSELKGSLNLKNIKQKDPLPVPRLPGTPLAALDLWILQKLSKKLQRA